MSAENKEESCLQRDSAERKGDVRTHRSCNRIGKERDSAEPDTLGKILERDNFNAENRRVKVNKGVPGIDGMTIDEMFQYLREHNHEIVAEYERDSIPRHLEWKTLSRTAEYESLVFPPS